MHSSSILQEKAGFRKPLRLAKKLGRLYYVKRMKRFSLASSVILPPADIRVNDRTAIFITEEDFAEIRRLSWDSASDKVRKEIDFVERIVEKQFRFLGHSFDFRESDVSWNLDPVTGKQWPQVFSFDIAYRGADRLSDIKLPWELGKMQYLYLLGKAYVYTGDERYLSVVVDHIESWIRANPPFRGIHWISALEMGMRVTTFIMVYPFLKRAMSPAFLARYVAAIYTQTEFIERNLSVSEYPNTHLVGEAFSLVLVGMFLDCKKSRSWYRKGVSILAEQIALQVHEDGIHEEQSFAYHRFFLDFYYLFIILHRRNNLAYPKRIDKVVERMTEVLLLSIMPNGALPGFGDADDARGIYVKPNCEGDCSGLCALGAVLFDRSDFAYCATGLPDEALWLLGPNGQKKLSSMDRVEPRRGPVSHEDAGYYIMRRNHGIGSDCMIFDCGPLGWGSAGHGHADALSFELQAHGFPFLVDPGTYSYNLDYSWRDYFRSTKAHNTIVVDEIDQSEAADRMSWKTMARSRCRLDLRTPWFDLVEGQHDGYQRLSDPVSHRRLVFFDKNRSWVIVDRLEALKAHTFDLYLHVHPEGGVEMDYFGRRLVLRSPEGRGLSVQMIESSDEGSDLSLFRGNEETKIGWYSARYGAKTPTKTVRLRSRGRGRTWFATFLDASEKALEMRPEFGDAVTFSIVDHKHHTVSTVAYSFDEPHVIDTPSLRFSGKLLFTDRSGRPGHGRVYATAVEKLQFDDVMFSSSVPVDFVAITAGTCDISLSDLKAIDALRLVAPSIDLVRVNGRNCVRKEERIVPMGG